MRFYIFKNNKIKIYSILIMVKQIKQNKNSKVDINHDSDEPSIKCNCGLSFKTSGELFDHKHSNEHKEILKQILTIDFN